MQDGAEGIDGEGEMTTCIRCRQEMDSCILYLRSRCHNCGIDAEEIAPIAYGLLEACEAAYEWLENAPLDYSNGVTHQGVDEGNVLGWRYHNELMAQLQAAIAKAKGGDE